MRPRVGGTFVGGFMICGKFTVEQIDSLVFLSFVRTTTV